MATIDAMDAARNQPRPAKDAEPTAKAIAEDSRPGDAPRATSSLDVSAAPDAVWRALTTDDGLAPWMGEGASIELVVGGRVVLPDPVGGATRRGRVVHFDADRALTLTWWPALRPAEQTTVTFTVTPIDEGTRIRVTEVRGSAPLPSGAEPTARRRSSPEAAVGSAAAGLPIGLWAWRLALLAVCASPCRV